MVEDDPGVRRSLQLLLQANGYDVRAYASGATLLADETSLTAACLVADYRMPEGDGIDTLVQLRTKSWRGPAILITGFPTPDLTKSARNAGFDAILDKPLREHLLVRTIGQLVNLDGAN